MESELRLHRCCFTGHRPEKLNRSEEEVKKLLDSAIRQAITDGFTTFITGMARGVDIWAGQIVLELKKEYPALKLVAASPYKGFEERWSASWQEQYNSILEKADAVRYICKGYSRCADCFHISLTRDSEGWQSRVYPKNCVNLHDGVE